MADFCGGRKPLFEDEDLQEEEVWSLVKAREDSNSKTRKNHFSGSSSSHAWRFNTAPRAIRRSGGGGSSTAWTEPRQSSAPVDIPDWSKISKRKSNKNLWDDASGAHDNDDDDDHMRWKSRHGLVDGAESYDDDDGIEMVPPHEYLARRLAGTQIASFSMCEGVGRTLKGRDLSKLRNAILTKTGFLE